MILDIEKAIDILKNGGVVAIPSETVYGLAACIDNESAIDKIFTYKGRPSKNPLIVHFSNLEQVLEFVDINPLFLPFLRRFWPGPLTFVAPLKKSVLSKLTAGLSTMAVRIPAHPIFLEVIEQTGPLAAPSANKSGLPSATKASHIIDDYNGLLGVVDDPRNMQMGVESTILIQNQDKLILGRLGATPLEEVKKYFPVEDQKIIETNPICPGQMFRHYAPNCILTQDLEEDCQVCVGFDEVDYPNFSKIYRLGKKQNPVEIASRLFDTLRKLDKDHIDKAFIDTNFPSDGLYATIHERLKKAIKK